MGEVPLRDHIDQRFRDLESRMEAAAGTLSERLEGMNAFRIQLEKERGNYIGRGEYETAHRDLSRRVEKIEQTIANFEGRLWIIGIVAAALGFFAAHVLKF